MKAFYEYHAELQERLARDKSLAYIDEEIVYALTGWKDNIEKTFILKNVIYHFCHLAGFRIRLIHHSDVLEACKRYLMNHGRCFESIEALYAFAAAKEWENLEMIPMLKC